MTDSVLDSMFVFPYVDNPNYDPRDRKGNYRPKVQLANLLEKRGARTELANRLSELLGGKPDTYKSSISAWIAGTRHMPNDAVIACAYALRVSPFVILGEGRFREAYKHGIEKLTSNYKKYCEIDIKYVDSEEADLSDDFEEADLFDDFEEPDFYVRYWRTMDGTNHFQVTNTLDDYFNHLRYSFLRLELVFNEEEYFHEVVKKKNMDYANKVHKIYLLSTLNRNKADMRSAELVVKDAIPLIAAWSGGEALVDAFNVGWKQLF